MLHILILRQIHVFEDRCYELRSLESDDRTTLVLSNTRELDRVSSTK